MIGRGTWGCHGTCLSTGVFFELRIIPVYGERTDSSIFLSFSWKNSLVAVTSKIIKKNFPFTWFQKTGGEKKREKSPVWTGFIKCIHSLAPQPCKFVGTKQSVYIRKEFNSHQYGCHILSCALALYHALVCCLLFNC